MKVNFLIIAWRGFSGNKGKPSETGLYEDGESAIKWLVKKGVDEKNIVIYGESLGTGVATHLSQNKEFAGVILETPFTSMIDAAKKFYPYIPVGLLLKDKFENKNKIKNIKLLKIEAEGAEPEVLSGAIATLKNTEYISVAYGNERGKDGLSTVVEVVNILISNNFEFIGDSNLRKVGLFRNCSF